ncbi:transcription factor bHLH68-like isoform X1 [Syzygium oleosum]|uniref:transcription factor bHLH68-like isoform X1 n=1 Tax=Syzygium oleosum TaxID=219896 RepID=UPI0011D29F1D|nr:transcription factor bHLH68-like isoform X1 [Syzygium oleosum]
MMAGNPNWWNMHPPSYHHHHHHQPPTNLLPPPYVVGSQNSLADCHAQELPQSWSQLLLGGLCSEEDNYKYGGSHFQAKKLENWEELQMVNNPSLGVHVVHHPHPQLVDVKQEVSQTSSDMLYSHGVHEELFLAPSNVNNKPAWPNSSNAIMPVSSPTSCVTTLNNNNSMLDFSSTNTDSNKNSNNQLRPDHSSECNSAATGGACKKARVHPSSSQLPLKVRKEKLGDRITALHQLVSPFGKTDTASVLLEAIGYIRFLQGQIEALSSPYLRNNESGNTRNHQSVQGEGNFAFPGDTSLQEDQDKPMDLKSRGLCLVPVSCTMQVGNESGADYWAPGLGGGF